MNTYRQQFPGLFQFLAGYFHQDWKDDYDWHGQKPSYALVVREFAAKNPPAAARRTADELAQFLALPLESFDLDRALREEFLCAYRAQGSGLTSRQWLVAVLDLLREPSGAASSCVQPLPPP